MARPTSFWSEVCSNPCHKVSGVRALVCTESAVLNEYSSQNMCIKNSRRLSKPYYTYQRIDLAYHLSNSKLSNKNVGLRVRRKTSQYYGRLAGYQIETRLSCFNVKTNCFILKKINSSVRLKLISSLG